MVGRRGRLSMCSALPKSQKASAREYFSKRIFGGQAKVSRGVMLINLKENVYEYTEEIRPVVDEIRSVLEISNTDDYDVISKTGFFKWLEGSELGAKELWFDKSSALKKRKGLPVIVVTQDVHHSKVVLNLHGYIDIRYDHFLWTLIALITVPMAWVIYGASQKPNWGYNIHHILSALVYSYSLDTFSKFLVDIFTDKKARVLRVFSIFDDCIVIIYAMVLPIIYKDPLAHMILALWKDFYMACGSDLFRIYFWPDNMHNRKRVANFNQSIRQSGLYAWWLMVKTPMIRMVCEHYCMEHFVVPDSEIWDWTAFMTFPLKVTAYEIVNDFFYYWGHRALHSNVWLYCNVHKLHHSSRCPTGMDAATMTFAESAFTFMLTNLVVPFIFKDMWPMTRTEWGLFICWISAIEIYGHSGLILDNNEMSLWRMGMSGLLTIAGIRLQTKDHELHHWHNMVNFGKRLQLWDKVFGTYDYAHQDLVSNAALAEAVSNKKRA